MCDSCKFYPKWIVTAKLILVRLNKKNIIDTVLHCFHELPFHCDFKLNNFDFVKDENLSLALVF